jgi:hypothetical protein
MDDTSSAGRSILIVEDEPLTALELRTAFGSVGARRSRRYTARAGKDVPMSSSLLTSPVPMSDALTMLGRVFDGVWQEVVDDFGDTSAATGIARTRLASIVRKLSKVAQLGSDQRKERASGSTNTSTAPAERQVPNVDCPKSSSDTKHRRPPCP